MQTNIDLENELRLKHERLLTSFGHNDFNKEERKSVFNWDLPKSMFHVDRVAFNKCKTSRKRKGLDRMIANYQEVYIMEKLKQQTKSIMALSQHILLTEGW